MEKNPKISVLMPTYNTKKEYLFESIKSILNQTYSDFEFLILDDGSTESSHDLIDSFNDRRIKYIYIADNRGAAEARNNLMAIARGEYIAIMDSDDVSLPTRFEKQVKYLDENAGVSVLGTYFERFPEKKIEKFITEPKYFDILKNNCIANPTVMYRRSDFEKYNLHYTPNIVCEDYEMWSRAIRCLKIVNLPEVLLKYRWHGENISIKKSDKTKEQDSLIRGNMLEFLTSDKVIQSEIIKTINVRKTKFYLFGFLPFVKVHKINNLEKWYLFNLILIFRIKRW